MTGQSQNDDKDALMPLLKELTEGLGRLISDHVALARLELSADAKTITRRFALLAVLVPFIFMGYGLICTGLAVVLSQWMGLGQALVLVGAVHLVGGAGAVAVVLQSGRKLRWLRETTDEANRSVSQLSRHAIPESPPVAGPVGTTSGSGASTREGESCRAEPTQ